MSSVQSEVTNVAPKVVTKKAAAGPSKELIAAQKEREKAKIAAAKQRDADAKAKLKAKVDAAKAAVKTATDAFKEAERNAKATQAAATKANAVSDKAGLALANAKAKLEAAVPPTA